MIDDGNFVVALMKKAAKMEELASMADDEQRLLDERLEEVFDGTDITLEVARKLVNEKERLFAELEGKVFDTCLSQTFQSLQDLQIERSYARQSKFSEKIKC